MDLLEADVKYERLNKAAKAKAREWWQRLEGETWGSDRAPDYYDDFIECLKHLGIEVKIETRHWRNITTGREGTKQEPAFHWSGFWSQGDGFVLEGEWTAEAVDLDKLQEHAPQDNVLTDICAEMTLLKLRWPVAQASITTVSAGPGLPYMRLDETTTDPNGDDEPLPEDDRRELKRLVERACDWCYRQLEANYEYDTGDEAAEEAIKANDYQFDRDGEFSGHGGRVYA